MKYVYKKDLLIGYTQPTSKNDRKVIRIGVNTNQLIKQNKFYILKEYM